jgi:two-component system cell cycle sensor histidine kinase/response regulator CckA
MDSKLRILHLEDNPTDVELIGAALKEAGMEVNLVAAGDRQEFLSAIQSGDFDLVISDFSFPSFSGDEALTIVREKMPDTPFIFVSGKMGEEAAIKSLLDGATDYVLKSNLARLVPAVRRALRDADEKRKLRLAEKMREMALEDLKASESRLRGVLETAPDAVVIISGGSKISFVNNSTERLFGYRREELLGKSLNVLVPDRFRHLHERQVKEFDLNPHGRAMNSGVELFGRRKDGTEFPADIMLSPLRMDHELSVLAMIHEITASKEAERALRESEQRFRSLVEVSPLGILSMGGDGKFLSCNPAAVKLFGYSEEELLQKHFNDLTHPDDKKIGLPVLKDLRSGKTNIARLEKRYIKKDGSVIIAQLTVSAVRDEAGRFKHAVTIIEDVSDRRMAEEAVRRSEGQYRSLVEGARDGIFSLSLDMVIESLNPAFETITGWKREDWLGKKFADILHPDDRKKASEIFRRMLKGGDPGLNQYRILKKSGDFLVGEFNTTVLIHDGKSVGILGIARDVTLQKTLEEQLRQSKKLESIGTLAGGIAHDFNNILGIILGFASLAKKSMKENGNVSKNLEMIEDAAQRGVGLIRQLLIFARKQEKVAEVLNLNELIRDVHKLISETFPKVISIELNLSKDTLLMKGDRTEIHQAILNLCVNARDAMMDSMRGNLSGGTLKIATALVRREVVRELFPTSTEEQYIRIIVEDTGIGMDERTLSHVFEPFFTTKEKGKGTGLGLALVYGIVNSLDGSVNVSSKLGSGTTVTIFLPVHEGGNILKAESRAEITDAKRGTETILVVEDEAGLRELLEEALTSNGYKVLTAADGQRAVALFLDYQNIKLVISDIGLPGIGGIDLLETFKRLNADVKIILASGFVEEEDRKEMVEHGVDRFIQKPYRIAEVLASIREVLDKK